MIFLFIAIFIVMGSLQTLFCTIFNKRYAGKSELSSSVFCVIESIVVPIILLLFMMFDIKLSSSGLSIAYIGLHFDISLFGIFLGVLNALTLFFYNTSLIKASAKGSYAFLSVMIVFGGIVIPVIYGALFFENEAVYGHQFFAIALMLFAVLLMNLKEIKLKGTSWAYYIYCFILFLTNGTYGLLLKIQSNYRETELNEMIVITYAVMGILALIQLIYKEKGKSIQAFKVGKKAILPLVICVLIVAFAINFNALIIPLVDTAIVFPVENGGVLVLAAIYSMVFFNEKPQTLKIVGIIISIISIAIISLPIETINNIF